MYFYQSRSYFYVAVWNTIFGYFTSIFVYKLIINFSNIILVSVIANIISISMSFLMYKIIVFKTSGNWFKEYLKCYIVYGASALISILVLWIYFEHFQMNIWVAQALTLLTTLIISYLGHKKFTFKN